MKKELTFFQKKKADQDLKIQLEIVIAFNLIAFNFIA